MDTLKSLGAEYDLTQEEFQKSLVRAELGVFLTCKPCEKPQSVFIVAQPGAGKTGLKNYIINRGKTNDLSSFIELNPDTIGIYHDHYADILEHYPDESFVILQRFIRPALDTYLRKKAVELRANTIQEGTFANREAYLDILDFQKNGGSAPIGKILPDGTREFKDVIGDYFIEIAVLAVDRYESLLSSYEREQYFRENNMHPRIVQPRYHDDSYNKMLDTLNEVEIRGLADRISVYERGYHENEPVLVWKSGDKRFMSVCEATKYYRQRNRERLMQEPQEYYRRLAYLRENAEDVEQLNRIKKLYDEFTHEIDILHGKETNVL